MGIVEKVEEIKDLGCTGGCTEEQIKEAENILGLTFPNEYKEYVKEFGCIDFGSTEWTGLNVEGELNTAEATLTEKKYNDSFPDKHFVLDDYHIDGKKAIVNEQGEVFLLQCDSITKISNTISEYLSLCVKCNDEVEVNPALKTHLDDGDKLVWYKDPTIVATWHSNGKLDVPCFDATDVTISAVNFRILKGHWRDKTEHSIGTESNHWLFNGRPISEYLELYPDFWKSNETKTAQPKKEKQPRQPRQKKETSANVINSEHEYKYESEKLLYGSSFSGLYPDKLKKQATPSWVAEDMVELLPDEVWRTDSKFLDIYCKSGIFLEIIINKLMEKVDYSVIGLYEPREIYKYIIENQIYAVCWNKEYLDLSRRVINGKASKEVNIHCIGPEIEYMYETEAEAILKNDRAQGSIDKAILGIDIRKEFFNNMKIDVVIGNPPYNNDIYIPFVETGHNLASTCSVFITPAKWQAKGGKKNEQFRAEIVPHMSKIVYYKAARDIFDIWESGGISYYLIDNEIHNKKYIKNKCISNKNLDTTNFEIHDCSKNTLLFTNRIVDIINKCSTKTSLKETLHIVQNEYTSQDEYGMASKNETYNISLYQGNDEIGYLCKRELKTTTNLDKYKVTNSRMVGIAVGYLDETGKSLGMNRFNILGPNCVPKGSFPVWRFFNTKNECDSFISYCYTKLIRFLYFMGVCGSAVSKEFFTYCPDPITFDHIFTDEELYKKYNLTPEEINIIESVIKERK